MRRAIDACHMQHGWLGCWLGLPPLKDWPNDGHLIQDRYCSVGFFLLQKGSLGTLGYGFPDQRGDLWQDPLRLEVARSVRSERKKSRVD